MRMYSLTLFLLCVGWCYTFYLQPQYYQETRYFQPAYYAPNDDIVLCCEPSYYQPGFAYMSSVQQQRPTKAFPSISSLLLPPGYYMSIRRLLGPLATAEKHGGYFKASGEVTPVPPYVPPTIRSPIDTFGELFFKTKVKYTTTSTPLISDVPPSDSTTETTTFSPYIASTQPTNERKFTFELEEKDDTVNGSGDMIDDDEDFFLDRIESDSIP